MISLRIIEILFPIFAIVMAGLVYGRQFRPNMVLPNRLNMDLFIPCLLFTVLTENAEDAELFGHFSLACTIVILASGIIAFFLARSLSLSPRTLCPPMMFSNAGNLGLPLIVLTFGEQALPIGVVMFIVCNFFHVTVGNYILGKPSNPFQTLFSPMIISVLMALGFEQLNVEIHSTLMQPISMLGQICVPLMLFSLGVRLLDADLMEWRLGLLVGLLSPIISVTIVFFLSPWLQLSPLQQGSLILFGALPPAVMNFIFAEHYGQEPSRVAAMVLFGNAASIVVLPLTLLYVLPNFT